MVEDTAISMGLTIGELRERLKCFAETQYEPRVTSSTDLLPDELKASHNYGSIFKLQILHSTQNPKAL